VVTQLIGELSELDRVMQSFGRSGSCRDWRLIKYR